MSIKLEHVSYTYMPGTPYEKEALKDVSLEIHKGEFPWKFIKAKL